MKNILISSFDMEVGGVERSLISMLNNFDYKNYNVDLMLYSHTGDLLNLLPQGSNLLKENKKFPSVEIIKYLENNDINLKIYSDDNHNILNIE